MALSGETYRDEFILPDNRSVGAIKVAPEKQGELYLLSAFHDVAQHQTHSRFRLRLSLRKLSGCVPEAISGPGPGGTKRLGQTVRLVRQLGEILRAEPHPIQSAVEGHFNHPHGRSWVNILDQVHPLMAEIVGERVPENGTAGTFGDDEQPQVQGRKKSA
jgi:hypothetical protein